MRLIRKEINFAAKGNKIILLTVFLTFYRPKIARYKVSEIITGILFTRIIWSSIEKIDCLQLAAGSASWFAKRRSAFRGNTAIRKSGLNV
jgi:hypothetical protein